MQPFLASEGMQEWINRPSADVFYGAPALVVISGEVNVPGAMIDCQLAAENLFLAAHAKGLGTCYMGFLTLAAGHPEARKLLGLAEGYEMMAAAVVGHPDVRPEGPPQRSPAKTDWVR